MIDGMNGGEITDRQIEKDRENSKRTGRRASQGELKLWSVRDSLREGAINLGHELTKEKQDVQLGCFVAASSVLITTISEL